MESDPNFNHDASYAPLQDEEANVTLFSKAGFLSTMSFWWLNPSMKQGKDKILEESDIPRLRYTDRAQSCYLKFTDQLSKKKHMKGTSESFSMFAVAEGEAAFKHEGYALAGGLFLAKCLESFSDRQWFFRTRLIGLQVRSFLSSAIYQKQLHLSNAAKVTHSPGEIVNYVTVDAYRIGEFPYWFHQIWSTTIQLCLALAIVYYSVGLATVAALIVIILTVLATSPLAKLQHKYQIKLTLAQDKRLRAIVEALANIKVLKLYAWEKHFKNVIEGLRIVQDPIRMIPDVAGVFIDAKVNVYGKIAYVSQTSWIQTGSMRENILFGSLMDPLRYQEVIRRCSLVKDLEMRQVGDLTEIGERGVTLSGGQKQRVQLARALYQDSDLYLLDDLFSAVDAHAATSLFNECVIGALSRKTVLLVTHQVDFLPAFDSILFMTEGKILKASTYDQLLACCQEFQNLVNADNVTVGSEKRQTKYPSFRESKTSKSELQRNYDEKQLSLSLGDQLIKKEERKTGQIGLKPYIQSFYVVVLGFGASRSIFSTLMTSLFRAPMCFYDSTPMGRILSRASSDLSVVDVDVAFRLSTTLGSVMITCSGYVILAILTWPVLFLIIPMVCLTTLLQRYSFASAKELMRTDGTTKSLIASHLGESIAGATTIRAFGEEEQFFLKNLDLIDRDASPYFHNFSANEWLIQRLEILYAIVLSFSALAMTLLNFGASASGFIGMSLSYGLSLNVHVVFVVQNWCLQESSITSVERLEQYMHIPSKAPDVVFSHRPPPNWPVIGQVKIRDLKGITCIYEGGQKIGIVGRTGSGKTTLISALFRLVEPTEGMILIDDIDISTIGLHDLRSRLGIIPQDLTLFSGSVRYNVDPLSEHTDQEIWEVLEKCQLREAICKRNEGLYSLVMQDGSNWSLGQRQLFCLGRALLKRSQILMLDEATASIDNATDSIIQKTIRREFAHCTVIVVAQRIPTVMDCDKVLAMSDGKIVEFDEPSKLMNKEVSLFGKLVREYWSLSASASI
ncbi:putative ABC transporter C family member 15 [Morella rubra]|uniref:ABC-type xenobiotic transporter n=1 Tax=Morella rubra TaxID=262757 RepID=A0A6A1URK4_9ROSI|nr:putative ABC transporter C family member 15 [Morella rubra]